VLARDAIIQEALRDEGIKTKAITRRCCTSHGGSRTKSGRPFQVFTPFGIIVPRWTTAEPLRAPATIPGAEKMARSLALAELALAPETDGAGLRAACRQAKPAAANLRRFLARRFAVTRKQRNRPTAGPLRGFRRIFIRRTKPRQIGTA